MDRPPHDLVDVFEESLGRTIKCMADEDLDPYGYFRTRALRQVVLQMTPDQFAQAVAKVFETLPMHEAALRKRQRA
jgi:hypothetical protein